MRGLLAVLFAFAFGVCVRLSRRAMRRSERYADWAAYCDERERALSGERP